MVLHGRGHAQPAQGGGATKEGLTACSRALFTTSRARSRGRAIERSGRKMDGGHPVNTACDNPAARVAPRHMAGCAGEHGGRARTAAALPGGRRRQGLVSLLFAFFGEGRDRRTKTPGCPLGRSAPIHEGRAGARTPTYATPLPSPRPPAGCGRSRVPACLAYRPASQPASQPGSQPVGSAAGAHARAPVKGRSTSPPTRPTPRSKAKFIAPSVIPRQPRPPTG